MDFRKTIISYSCLFFLVCQVAGAQTSLEISASAKAMGQGKHDTPSG